MPPVKHTPPPKTGENPNSQPEPTDAGEAPPQQPAARLLFQDDSNPDNDPSSTDSSQTGDNPPPAEDQPDPDAGKDVKNIIYTGSEDEITTEQVKIVSTHKQLVGWCNYHPTLSSKEIASIAAQYKDAFGAIKTGCNEVDSQKVLLTAKSKDKTVTDRDVQATQEVLQFLQPTFSFYKSVGILRSLHKRRLGHKESSVKSFETQLCNTLFAAEKVVNAAKAAISEAETVILINIDEDDDLMDEESLALFQRLDDSATATLIEIEQRRRENLQQTFHQQPDSQPQARPNRPPVNMNTRKSILKPVPSHQSTMMQHEHDYLDEDVQLVNQHGRFNRQNTASFRRGSVSQGIYSRHERPDLPDHRFSADNSLSLSELRDTWLPDDPSDEKTFYESLPPPWNRLPTKSDYRQVRKQDHLVFKDVGEYPVWRAQFLASCHSYTITPEEKICTLLQLIDWTVPTINDMASCISYDAIGYREAIFYLEMNWGKTTSPLDNCFAKLESLPTIKYDSNDTLNKFCIYLQNYANELQRQKRIRSFYDHPLYASLTKKFSKPLIDQYLSWASDNRRDEHAGTLLEWARQRYIRWRNVNALAEPGPSKRSIKFTTKSPQTKYKTTANVNKVTEGDSTDKDLNESSQQHDPDDENQHETTESSDEEDEVCTILKVNVDEYNFDDDPLDTDRDDGIDYRDISIFHANKTDNKNNNNKNCIICNKSSHFKVMECNDFKACSLPHRRAIVIKHGLCFRCLKSGHNAINCPSKVNCKTCNRSHHSMLHDFRTKPSPNKGGKDDKSSASTKHDKKS